MKYKEIALYFVSHVTFELQSPLKIYNYELQQFYFPSKEEDLI